MKTLECFIERKLTPLLVLSIIVFSNFVLYYNVAGNSAWPNSFSLDPQPSNSNSVFVTNNSIVFHALNIVLIFSGKNGAMESIDNLLTGQLTNLSGYYPLWSINTMASSFTANNANSFSVTIDDTNSTLYMFWTIEKPQFSVLVEVEPDTTTGGVAMSIDVNNFNKNQTITSVNFPYMAGFDRLGDSVFDNLAVPKRDGMLIPNFQEILKNQSLGLPYPGALSMQFFLIYDNSVGGLYEAAQDPGSNYKSLEVASHTFQTHLFNIYWNLASPQIFPGNQFSMNYSIVLAGFAGETWADGAQLYKGWALKQWYTEAGTLPNRADIPQWFKNIGVIWKGGPENSSAPDPNSEMPNITRSVQKYFPNETVLLDWWGWNQYGFDRGYPDYYPPLGGQSAMELAINQTEREGGKVMLFFSGRLVDTNTSVFQEHKNDMIVGPNGQIYIENFSKEPFAVPDPTTAWWKSEVVNYTTTGVKDYHIDGVYLDSVAVASPMINYANSSNPTLSGGTWWKAFAGIFTAVRNSIRQYNPSAIVTSEGVCEVYIPYLDGFWDNLNQDNASGILGGIQIPLFSYIYHSYALVYGTPFSYYPSPSIWEYELSKAAAFGLIVKPDIPAYEFPIKKTDITYLNNVLGLQQRFGSYLRLGSTLPPPLISAGVVQLNLRNNYTVELPAVSASVFESSNGSLLFSLVNAANLTEQVTVHFYSGELGGSILKSVNICQIAMAENNCLDSNGNGNANFTISALSQVVFSLTPTFFNTSEPSTNITTSTNSSNINAHGHLQAYLMIAAIFSIILVISASVLVYRAHDSPTRHSGKRIVSSHKKPKNSFVHSI
jgi:hypothetical protein